jgi:hypothetical protein
MHFRRIKLREANIGREGFTMSDPQIPGLGELGQRVQAMSDPAPEPRLRPYQGTPLPVGTSPNGNASNGRTIPAYEPREDFRATPTATHSAPASPYTTPYTTPYVDPYTPPNIPPAVPEPYSPLGNGTTYAHGATPAPAATPPLSLPAPEDPNAPKSGLQRAINAVRSTLPLVQRLLPLLEGNFATAIGALMAPQTSHHPPPPPPVQQVQVDLEPVERGLAEVRTSHRELRGQVLEQGTTLKRVEDQLERVREATDRNTLEQQELIEDLRSTGSRISTFAMVGLLLLAISLGLNIYFLVQLQHILH